MNNTNDLGAIQPRNDTPMNVHSTPQGFECYAVIDGHLKHVHYIGYTKREAIASFRAEILAPLTAEAR